MSDISVVVPSHDHARFIERTLRSIFAQTAPIAKLIVIDDGSTDDSPQVIRRVLSECNFPNELIVRENRGLSATLNEGFAKTHSEYFAYLGSDDVWLPTMVEKQIALLKKRPKAALAYCHAYVIDEHDQIFDRTDRWSRFADGDMLSHLLRGEIFSSPGVLYRRSAVEPHLWNEDADLEDYELYLRLSLDSEFARNEELLCAWRIHGKNASGDPIRMLEEQLAAQRRVLAGSRIDNAELESIQRRMRFNVVPELVRRGQRAAAWRLFRENAPAGTSPVQSARMLGRLLVPQSIFQWNRRRKRRRDEAAFGKLKV